jgi:hypothetical protein
MSDLTDFFPATGGGGTVSFDPMTLDRRACYSNQLTLNYTASSPQYSYASNFWSYWDAIYDYATVPNTTDYVTVKDITSAPRGGRLHSIIGPATITGTTNFKITVDGTEYIVPVSPLQTEGTVTWGNNSRVVLGGSRYGRYVSSTTPNMYWAHGMAYDTYFNDAQANNGPGGAVNPRAGNGNWLTMPADPYAYNGIYFKETLKIEVQCTSLYSSGAYTNTGAATSTF